MCTIYDTYSPDGEHRGRDSYIVHVVSCRWCLYNNMYSTRFELCLPCMGAHCFDINPLLSSHKLYRKYMCTCMLRLEYTTIFLIKYYVCPASPIVPVQTS